MSNKLYDILKWIAQDFLPFCGFIYYGISIYCQLPYVKEVTGIIMTLDAGLGVLLHISSSNYNKMLEQMKGGYFPQDNDPMEDDLK